MIYLCTIKAPYTLYISYFHGPKTILLIAVTNDKKKGFLNSSKK